MGTHTHQLSRRKPTKNIRLSFTADRPFRRYAFVVRAIPLLEMLAMPMPLPPQPEIQETACTSFYRVFTRITVAIAPASLAIATAAVYHHKVGRRWLADAQADTFCRTRTHSRTFRTFSFPNCRFFRRFSFRLLFSVISCANRICVDLNARVHHPHTHAGK